MRLASYELTIEAPAEVVWRLLTTGDGLVRWVGPEATADPVPDGGLRWVHPNGATVIGRFVELVPYRRLVFTYGWEDGRLGVPAGSTTVEIELSEEDGVTTLRLTHRGLPPAAVADHERGWAHFLGLLRGAASARRSGVTDFVHVGLVVEDLDETVRFLELLGFDCGEPGVISGEWIDRIIGLENATVEVLMARAPDGSDMFEVVRFHSPSAGAQEPAPPTNRPGLRHIAFKVGDVRDVVDRVRAAGWDTVGEIVDFENMFLLCYVRGPDGLIVELAERLDGAPG